jgi:hypothetical protein
MLDLKKLERQLDEALEKETSESLTTWLLNQRIPHLPNLLNNICFKENDKHTFSLSDIVSSQNITAQDIQTPYLLAA